jgi:beta-glucosidase
MTHAHAESIAALPLERKVELLTGSGYFTMHAAPELGLTSIRMSDGPTGVRGTEPGHTAALLPNATLLAASWDESLLAEVGQLLGEESEAQQVHVLLGPTINLHRTPLGGRLFEMFSEDPLLTGRLAAAYVRGVQSRGVAACLKHLAANESETLRTTVSSEVDEATLRELYLLPFQIAIEDSHPWCVMAAYNDVNGIPSTEHPFLLTQVLRTEWGWDGVVMSDWGATKTAGPAANAGLDLVMPGPRGPWGQSLVDAVKDGEVDESVIDQHVARLHLLGERVGAVEPTRMWPSDLPKPEQRRAQLTRLAAGGMTVLTNNGVLPLDRSAEVALIGRHAVATIGMGGGSAEVFPPYVVTAAEGLGATLPSLAVVDGVEVRERLAPALPHAVVDPVTGEPGMRLTILDADGAIVEERHMTTGKDHVTGPAHRLVLTAEIALDEPVAIGAIGVGSWQLRIGDTAVSLDLHARSGTLGEESLAPPTAATGVTASNGTRIEATVDIAAEFPHRNPWGTWGLSVAAVPVDDETLIARAEMAAAAAGVAVVVVGLTEEQETEALDKHTLALPGRQDDLVQRVAAAASKTVVVVNAATPILMPWLADVDAVLWAGLPGQEAGHAMAAALTGDIEPAGRLVTTFPSADGATPAWAVQPTVDGKIRYDEGTFVGYRGHAAKRAPEPLFWLGHGLGYSNWAYEEMHISGGTRVTVQLRNTGTRVSREVVQVYVEPDDATQPTRLVGWSAAEVGPGETAAVDVELDGRALQRWTVEGFVSVGDGRLVVARGLGDVRLDARLSVTA